jgi:hypothetical protein
MGTFRGADKIKFWGTSFGEAMAGGIGKVILVCNSGCDPTMIAARCRTACRST